MSASELAPNWLKKSSSSLFNLKRVNMSASQPLSSLPPGSAGKVTEIKIPGSSRPRLMEMGLLVGTPVELVRFAPLGDPVEIKVRGYHLTLRKHEADQIFVSVAAQ
jgi:ferrous iron transport protein A